MMSKYSPHARVFRTVKSILAPNQEKGLKPYNLSYISHIAKSKKESILFASFPASGWNWTADVITHAVGNFLLNDFEIKYIDAPTLKQAEVKPFHFCYPADARVSNQPSLPQQLPKIDADFCYHTHGYYGESPLMRLGEGKTVLITRSFITSLYSQYSKRRLSFESFEEYLKKTDVMERLVRFYNSWGSFLDRQDTSRFHIVSYEAMRDDSLSVFKKLISFSFNFDVPDVLILEALDYYSFAKQKEREQKFNNDEKQHFHYKGKKSYKDEIDPETYQWLVERLGNELTHKFGYIG